MLYIFTSGLRDGLPLIAEGPPTLHIFINVIVESLPDSKILGLIPMTKFVTWLIIYGWITKVYKKINESSDSWFRNLPSVRHDSESVSDPSACHGNFIQLKILFRDHFFQKKSVRSGKIFWKNGPVLKILVFDFLKGLKGSGSVLK